MNMKEQPLEPRKPYAMAGFTPKRQQEWLELYKQHGNVTKACELVGINRQTFYNALQRDEAFMTAYQNAIDALCDNLEEVMLESAHELGKQGFMDRIAYLRAHRPEKFSDKVRIEHTSTERVKHVIGKLDAYKNVIDAEIVPEPLDKERPPS